MATGSANSGRPAGLALIWPAAAFGDDPASTSVCSRHPSPEVAELLGSSNSPPALATEKSRGQPLLIKYRSQRSTIALSDRKTSITPPTSRGL